MRIWAERGLVGDPRLGVGKWLERATALPDGPFHDAPVDQEQERRSCATEWQLGPEFGAAEVKLEVQPDVADGLVNERTDVLIVAMRTKVGEPTRPCHTQLASRGSRHGIEDPRRTDSSSATERADNMFLDYVMQPDKGEVRRSYAIVP
jgi:hypothetical protein